MNNPKVSIVIPTFNQPQYIIRAVESALMQDYGNLEVIVSDDSENDETKKLLGEYISKQKITYYHNLPRLGRVANYRKCLFNYATGEWLVNLDGDDYFIDKEFISKSIEAVDNDNSIVFVIANGTIHYPNGIEVEKKIPGVLSPYVKIAGKQYFKNFARGRGFFHLTIMYNIMVARSIDFYRMDILSADIESIMRLALMGNVILLDRNAGVWFLHQNNTSSNAEITKFIENTEWIDSVVKFGKEKNLIKSFYGKLWTYLVKQQELTGFFMTELKKMKGSDQSRYLLKILTLYPATFFFPVFLKKFTEYVLLKK